MCVCCLTPTQQRGLKIAAELMAAWKTAQQFLQFFDVLWSSNAKNFWKDNCIYNVLKDDVSVDENFGFLNIYWVCTDIFIGIYC